MLKVVEYGKDEYEFPSLLVLGCFDAIHVGHRELIKKARLQAKINGLDLGVMLFRDGKGGKLVYSFEERLELLEQFNVKFVLAVDFNEEFKRTAPLDFLHTVEEKINVKAYMSGKDFRFGAQAKGKSSTLKSYADDEENGVWYMPVKDVVLGGEKISTTLIKTCLDAGDVAKADELLGENFFIRGEVVRGAGRGTSVVGFPTVNIVYPRDKYPLKHGVYKVKSTIEETEYFGIANFGTCPTFDDDRIALEVYFENFEGDLYGKVLKIEFLEFLREIVAFGSPEELTDQLKTDAECLEGITNGGEENGLPSGSAPVNGAAEEAQSELADSPQPPVADTETAESASTDETAATENESESTETAEEEQTTSTDESNATENADGQNVLDQCAQTTCSEESEEIAFSDGENGENKN